MFKVTSWVASLGLNIGSLAILSHFIWQAHSNANQKGMLEKPNFSNPRHLKDLSHTLNISFKTSVAPGVGAGICYGLLVLPEAQGGWHSRSHCKTVQFHWALSKDPKISQSPPIHGHRLSGTPVVHQTLRPGQAEWEMLRGSEVEHRGKGVSGSNQFHQLRLKEKVGLWLLIILCPTSCWVFLAKEGLGYKIKGDSDFQSCAGMDPNFILSFQDYGNLIAQY